MPHHCAEQVGIKAGLVSVSPQPGVSTVTVVAEDRLRATDHQQRRDDNSAQHLDELLRSEIK